MYNYICTMSLFQSQSLHMRETHMWQESKLRQVLMQDNQKTNCRDFVFASTAMQWLHLLPH